MMRTDLPPRVAIWGAALFGLPLLVSCVPYQQYDKALAELQEAKTANDDLVRRYHQELMRRGQGGGEVSDAEFARLLREKQELEARLAQRPSGSGFDDDDLRQFPANEVTLADGGLVLGESLLFSPGVAELKKTQLPVLDTLARILSEKYPGERVIVEGHTDNQDLVKTRKRYEDNPNLGYERARAVFKYLRDKHEIGEQRMVLVTYGYAEPVDPSDVNSDEGRRQNRRVVVRRAGGARSLVRR